MFFSIRLVKWLIAAGLVLLGLVLVTTGLHLSLAALTGPTLAGLVTGSSAFLLAHAQYPALAAYPVPAGVLLILLGLLLFVV